MKICSDTGHKGPIREATVPVKRKNQYGWHNLMICETCNNRRLARLKELKEMTNVRVA